MGFFDKLKVAVGVGNASLQLEAPLLLTSEQPFVAKVTLSGGKQQQKLTKLDAQFVIKHERSTVGGQTEPDTRIDLTVPRISADIAAGSTSRFELPLTALPTQDLFANDPQDYAQLLLGEEEERAWNAEGPLPMTNVWLGKQCSLYVGADIPGAPDPGALQQVFHLPQSVSRLAPVKGLSTSELEARLRAAGAARVWVSNKADQWFVFWQDAGGLTVAHSPLQVVCSARPDGLHRAYTNPNIPAVSAMQRLPNETEAQRAGDLDEGRVWAQDLVAQSEGAVLLPRPVGNAWVALTQLHLPV